MRKGKQVINKWTKKGIISNNSKHCKANKTVCLASKELGAWLAAGIREGLFEELILDLRME